MPMQISYQLTGKTTTIHNCIPKKGANARSAGMGVFGKHGFREVN